MLEISLNLTARRKAWRSVIVRLTRRKAKRKQAVVIADANLSLVIVVSV